jgi:hypothetical protein
MANKSKPESLPPLSSSQVLEILFGDRFASARTETSTGRKDRCPSAQTPAGEPK